MGRRSRRRRRGIGLLAVLVGVVLYAALGPTIRPWLGLEAPRLSAPASDTLRIATFNLRNFPTEKYDTSALQALIAELAPDVLAVQEVHDGALLASLLPAFEVHVSEQGGRGHQRVGLALRRGRVVLVGAPVERQEVSAGGRVRPALTARLQATMVTGGPLDFFVAVVHLKAGPDGYALRRSQWDVLAKLTDELAAVDPDVIVLGDWNTTGPREGASADELAALDTRLAGTGLRRLEVEEGCTAYWDGRRRDAWKEPALLDHIFLRGLERYLEPGTRLRSTAHCARHACRVFRSTDTYPERSYEGVSDHCPVALDLRARDDSPAKSP